MIQYFLPLHLRVAVVVVRTALLLVATPVKEMLAVRAVAVLIIPAEL